MKTKYICPNCDYVFPQEQWGMTYCTCRGSFLDWKPDLQRAGGYLTHTPLAKGESNKESVITDPSEEWGYHIDKGLGVTHYKGDSCELIDTPDGPIPTKEIEGATDVGKVQKVLHGIAGNPKTLEKTCSICSQSKPLDLFYTAFLYCKECTAVKTTAWRKSNAPRVRGYRLKEKFGMTLIEYQALLESQGSGCAICGQQASSDGTSLSVDHDHETGKVRGILCNNCNHGLGKFRDDPTLLTKGANYVRAYRGN